VLEDACGAKFNNVSTGCKLTRLPTTAVSLVWRKPGKIEDWEATAAQTANIKQAF
jgi:hypothetical protein